MIFLAKWRKTLAQPIDGLSRSDNEWWDLSVGRQRMRPWSMVRARALLTIG
jgi:hypothetical protein